jgi:hypothetical protein
MATGRISQRLETEVQKLNNVIDSLIEENHLLKSMLTQYASADKNNTVKNKQ